MGRAIGKAEHGIKKVERKIEKAGENFEKGYEKEKSAPWSIIIWTNQYLNFSHHY